MTDVQHPGAPATASDSKLIRIAIWVAIGALIAAAIVCVVWVLVGTQNGLIGRAFLTILLLAAFAGVALLDARLAERRPAWFALTSMVVWVVTLLLGAFLIWMPDRGFGFGIGFGRFASFLLIVLILQLAVLHVRLYVKAYQRFVTPFTTVVALATIALVAVLAFMLVFPLAFHEFINFSDLYWRWVIAFAILAAVGTALVPLVNALFAPKKPRAEAGGAPIPAPAPWPTYADGVTPLPVLSDGSPDWNAYYTGYPSQAPQAIAPVAPQAVGTWHDPQQGWTDAGAQPAWEHTDPSQRAWTELAAQQGWEGQQQAPAWPQQTPAWQPYPHAPEGDAPSAAPEQQWGAQQQAQPWWNQPQPGWGEAPAAEPQDDEAVPPPPPGYEGYPPPPPLPPRG